jgi:threonine/homoserine/homoserine lactone efflux protein
MGFITNVTNPKVTLFFLSLFTQVIDPGTPLSWQILYGIEMSLATIAWFVLVAIKNRVVGIQHYAEKAMGVILIALGIKLALSKAN